MAATIKSRAQRKCLTCALLMGLGTNVAWAAEPTPLSSVSQSLSITKRTDANMQKDIEAARNYLKSLQTDAPQKDQSPTPDPSAESRAFELELPKDDKPQEIESESTKTDDAAKEKPSLGSKSPESMERTFVEPSTLNECDIIVYEPIDTCPPGYVTIVESPKAVSAQKPATPPSPSVSSIWTEEALVKRVEDLSGGTLVLSTIEESSETTSTRGYSPTNESTPSDRSKQDNVVTPNKAASDSIRVLPPPTYSRVGDTTFTSYSVPSTTALSLAASSSGTVEIGNTPIYQANYAADPEAQVQPSLGSDMPSNSAVVPAAFQGGTLATPPGYPTDPSALQTPSLAAPPTFGAPSSGSSLNQPVLPPPSSTTLPSSPYTSPSNSTVAPAPMTNPGNFGTVPNSGTSVPYDMPQYPRSAPIVTGEPFVTEGPCQFDAAYMVTPAYGTSQQCGPYAPAYQNSPGNVSLPGYYAPAAITPNQLPNLYASNNAGLRPLFSLGQENYNVQIGRGIIGQPVAYVPGQSFRNFFRYLFP